METIIPYAVWLVLILIVLGVIAIALFGLRNLVYGKVSTQTIVLVMIPVLILLVLGMIQGDWAEAAIITALITLVLGIVALFLAGLRGLVGL